jgi:hypothetical protein
MIFTLFIHVHKFPIKHMCWHSITKIHRNGPRAHFPFTYSKAEDTALSAAFEGRKKKRLNRVFDAIGFVYPDYRYPTRGQKRKILLQQRKLLQPFPVDQRRRGKR